MRNFKKYILLIAIIMGASFLFFYGFTLAKYVANSVWDYYLQAKGFYFNSDQLAIHQVKNIDNLWNGGPVNFNIRNNLNDLVITDYDINYEVACTITNEAKDYAECHLNGTTSNLQSGVLSSFEACVNKTGDGVNVAVLNKADCELGGYEWVRNIAVKDLYFEIVSIDESYELANVTVNVKVTSTEPYRKVLQGDFILNKVNTKTESVTLNYKNYANYDKLIVSNSYASNKCVKLKWDAAKLLIDAKDEEFSSYELDNDAYINEIKFLIDAKASVSYVFYKRDFTKTYNVEAFTVEEDNDC